MSVNIKIGRWQPNKIPYHKVHYVLTQGENSMQQNCTRNMNESGILPKLETKCLERPQNRLEL